MSSTFDLGAGIAIIGMAGRFPGARNVAEFWEKLRDGAELVRFADDAELTAMGVDEALLHDPSYVKAVSVLDGIELFDAAFFGYTPREAELMDPQHRIFMECAWEALESAGYEPTTHRGVVGVFAGATTNTYLLLNLFSNPKFIRTLDPVQIEVSNGADFLATRVSYNFNLKGPSCTIQTACSTSLATLHYACQSLLNEECDLALAGGVTIQTQHRLGYRYLEGSILSPDGHCRAFDAEAAGTVMGSGVGVVILKRLKEAVADGDHIRAVIRGSAINNDGADKVGYTAPSVEGQAKVITEAMAVAGVEADTISYVETHGTGTKLGDPIEVRALIKAFRQSTTRNNYCAIGSVKTNIGHLSGAAGVASLIKTVLALENGLMLPSLHFKQPNPEIDFANSPFFVNTELTEWKTHNIPRRAGVSSFGMGGTNVHAILEEAPAMAPSGPSRPVQLLLLSAKTDTALESATSNLLDHLKRHPDLDLADVAYTLQVGRQAFSHRRVVMCRDLEDAIQALETRDPQRVFTGVAEIQGRPVAFMFPGQGTQYVNMARQLYETEAVFRGQVNACVNLLQPYLELDLRALLYPDAQDIDQAARQLNQTLIAQPTLFVIEYALAQLWAKWGVRPKAMIGHSIGEYVAACLAGVFSLKDALALVATRGRLMQSLPSGSMITVFLSREQLQPLLGPELSLAAINAPQQCTVSGPTVAIEALENRLAEQEIACRRLHTSHAFHSAMMDPILEPFTQQVRRVRQNSPRIPYISNLTGNWIEDTPVADSTYWTRHLRQTVRFSDGIRTLIQDPSQVLLEVGPGNTLAKLAQKHVSPGQTPQILPAMRHPREQGSDVEFLLTALGKLWLTGANVDWSGFYANERRHRVPLPTYPFERERFWIEPQAEESAHQIPALKKPDIADWFYLPTWKSTLRPVLQPGSLASKKLCWLIFSDGYGVSTQLAEHLEREGQHTVRVTLGTRFTKTAHNAYTIDHRQAGDYDLLLTELNKAHLIPQKIVHMGSVTQNRHAQPTAQSFEAHQYLGFYSLLFLVQALDRHSLHDPLEMVVVSNGLHEVTSIEELCPDKATVLALCQTIPQEYPYIACRTIDIVLPELIGLPHTEFVEQLVAEMSSESRDSVVAYRQRQRWVRTFEPVRVDGLLTKTRKLREGGVYLITGGLSDVELALAEYLAQAVQARPVLMAPRELLDSRVSLETVGEFAARNTGDQTDQLKQVTPQIQKLRQIEDQGSQVWIASADTADERQMQELIARIDERLGAIHGVIHPAGTKTEMSFRAMRDITFAEAQAYFWPEVESLYVLEKALDKHHLDFCLLHTALLPVFGGAGLAAYTAVASFINAFAWSRHRLGCLPWTSVNWDVWQLDEDLKPVTANQLDLTQLALSVEERGQVLQRIVAAGILGQILVSKSSLRARIERASLQNRRSHDPVQPASPASHKRPDLKTQYEPPRNALEQQIVELWQRALGIDGIGIHDDFFELGGDSLLAGQLIFQMRQALGVDIPLANLFKQPTVASVADCIETIRWTSQGKPTLVTQGSNREEGVL